MAIALTISADLELFFQYLEEEKKKTPQNKTQKNPSSNKKTKPKQLVHIH